MRQIDDWLEGLELGQYTQLFIENGIDLEVLPDLSDQDLEKLGVLLGHRRKLLRAIKDLCVAQPNVPQARDEPAVEQGVERRQLTVMFADLVGSTALSALFDPEDLRLVYRAYRHACVQVVARYDGHLAQFMGDGVMVYFGYPRAHEDDAERAVRAGLDIIAAVGWLRSPTGGQIEVRVGIATGLVVAGDLSIAGQAAVGETPNLAARLQGTATPGTVVVAASTRHLLGELFQLKPLGEVTVKGIAKSVEAWTVNGETPSENRFEMVRARRLTSFVGREREFTLLDEFQRQAWGGEGRIVHIVGEAGIGKSRFAAQFAASIADQPYTRVGLHCSPYHTTSAFHPIIAHLKRAADWEPSDPPDLQLDKLEAMLALATSRVSDVAPLFAALLSLPPADRHPPLELSTSERRQRTLAALVEQLEGLACKQPVLLLCEDMHWADASTLELLDLIVERVRDLPVLMLVISRPEFTPRYVGLSHAATLTLGRLEQAEVRAMIDQVSAGRSPPDEVTAQIVAKADGVPLFIEELTKAVLESGLLVEDAAQYRLEGPLPPLAIPATLRDSLTARLDRLAPVKEIAAIGALIGREFSGTLLQRVAGRHQAVVDAALAQLEEAELLFRIGKPPDVRYRFKHALIQDAAYESLLKSRRQVLHQRIADTLCNEFPTIADAEPEVIARHYTEAGLTELAVDWWSKAGENAAGRLAFIEAFSHYDQAVALADVSPAEPSRRPHRLKLQIAYARILSAVRTPGAPETTAAFARARELAEEIEDPAERLSLFYGLWAGSLVRGELASARQLAETFLRDTEREPGSQGASIAQRVLGMTACMEGDLVNSRVHLEQSVAAYNLSRDNAFGSGHDHDVGVGAMCNLAIVLWQLGEVGRACQLAEEGLCITRGSRNIPTMLYGYFYKSIFETQRHDAVRARPSAQSLFDLCSEHFPRSGWLAGATFMLEWSRLETGDRASGITRMRQAIAFFREQGIGTYQTLYRAILARSEASAGEAEAALETLDEAFAGAERTGLQWLRPELHRQRAEILLLRQRPDLLAAEASFESALSIARRQEARSFELRAALGLGQLYRTTGRAGLVHDLLAPVLATLNGEPDLPELGQAQQLLVTASGFPARDES